jgi:hypothetical protein
LKPHLNLSLACCELGFLLLGLGFICFKSGGIKALSIGGYGSVIDQNLALTEHKQKTYPNCDCAQSSVVRLQPGMLLFLLLDQI